MSMASLALGQPERESDLQSRPSAVMTATAAVMSVTCTLLAVHLHPLNDGASGHRGAVGRCSVDTPMPTARRS